MNEKLKEKNKHDYIKVSNPHWMDLNDALG
jgi:hypothetical protein